MSIQTQLRKSAIASTFLSIILIAAVVSGGIEILLSIYRETIRDKMTEYCAERGIDATVFLHEFFPEGEKQLFANGMGSLLPTVVLLLITILIVTTTSTFFSARASRRILEPLNELKTAADHVVQADLDYTINYREDNEFGLVCGAFKEMQTHLKGLIRETLNQEQSRKELIAGISHDLRTPLTAIKGYVRGLQDGVATTPEKTERYLATILAKTTEMEVLVERLFLYSNLDAGSEVMYFSEVDIAEFLIGFLDVVRHDMAQKGLSITYAPAPGGNVRVSIDCDQMGRVLNNILGNSAKYKTKETGNITIRTYLDGDRLFLEIADDGEGVPEETLPKIFNILYRVDSARANPHKGNGIGLAIAKRIVAAHCGTIEAKNEDGLTITIMLPVKDLVNESVGEFADGPAQAPPKGEPA